MIKDVLLAGTGPAAVQYAVLLQNQMHVHVSMCGRTRVSARAQAFYQAAKVDYTVSARTQNARHDILSGKAVLSHLYQDYSEVSGYFDTLVLAVTADAYRSVIQALSKSVLENLRLVILVSPTFGSHWIVQGQIEALVSDIDIEVISLSTYLGDTRHIESEVTSVVLTTGIKKYLYLGSTNKSSKVVHILETLFKQIGIEMILTTHPLMAESRNSSLYVHPALFMNTFALNAIFEQPSVPVYVYKLFPEGPITMRLIREMRLMWQEMNTILEYLSIPKLNLLQFMTEENYPIRQESMDKADIMQFETLPTIHQEYLLYVRYTAILIDPFSIPDQAGCYFDFSAVPFETVYRGEDNAMQIPRMPSEDYYRTKIIQGIGHALKLDTPMIDTFIARYEQRINDYREAYKQQQFAQSFFVQTFSEDITLIQRYLK